MSNYFITEAFKEFNILDEAAEEFALNPESLNDMVSFIDRVGDDDDDIEIYDLQAQAEDELQDSYNGKVILQCKVCKSDVFEDKDNIEINEDGLVNVSTECPYCQSNDGYNIIGQISPFKAGMEFEEPEVDNDDEVSLDSDVEPKEIEFEDEDEEIVEEGLKRMPYSKRRKNESLRKNLKESIDDADPDVVKEVRNYVETVLENTISDDLQCNLIMSNCPSYNGAWCNDDGSEWDYTQKAIDNLVNVLLNDYFKYCGEDWVNESLKRKNLKESYLDDFYDEFDPDGDHESGFGAHDEDELDEWLNWLEDTDLEYDYWVNDEDDDYRDEDSDGNWNSDYYAWLTIEDPELDESLSMKPSDKLKKDKRIKGKKELKKNDKVRGVKEVKGEKPLDEAYFHFVDNPEDYPDYESAKQDIIDRFGCYPESGKYYTKNEWDALPCVDSQYGFLCWDDMKNEDPDSFVNKPLDEAYVLQYNDYRVNPRPMYIPSDGNYGDYGNPVTDVSMARIFDTPEEAMEFFEQQFDNYFSGDIQDIIDDIKPVRVRVTLDEAINDISITTDDETMTMTTKDDGGISLETTPVDDTFAEPGDEVIAPIDEMEQDEIIDDALAKNEEPVDDIDFEGGPLDDLGMEDEELPFDEFDEESFDGLGESYLRRCYENVNGFKTTDVSCKGKNLVVEGIITFDSGNQKKTKFVFESVKNRNGKVRFTGLNEQISRGKKSFKLNCSLDNTKLVCESLNYNYHSKNDLNESVRVYGTVRK